MVDCNLLWGWGGFEIGFFMMMCWWMVDFKNFKFVFVFEVKVEGCLRYLIWMYCFVKYLSKVFLFESL